MRTILVAQDVLASQHNRYGNVDQRWQLRTRNSDADRYGHHATGADTFGMGANLAGRIVGYCRRWMGACTAANVNCA